MRTSTTAATLTLLGLLAGPAHTALAADSRRPFKAIRDCESCVAVPGYGWCPLARRCSPGYPGKAGTCSGGATDFARSSVVAADERLKEALQEEERVFNVAVLYHNVGGLAGDPVAAVTHEWEAGAQALDAERDVRFYSIDCAAHAATCDALLPESEVAAAAAAAGSAVAQFYPAGEDAGNWVCPGGQEACDRAYPRGRRVDTGNHSSGATAADLQEGVAQELARERGFPLPKLQELAGDFVRAAVMRSGDVDGDSLEQALLDKARAMVAEEGGEYGTSPQQRAAGQYFVNAMQEILKEPAGREGRRVSALSRMGNAAASATRGNHHSLESYVNAKARDYAISSMTGPLLGR